MKYVDLGARIRNATSSKQILEIIEDEILETLPQRIVIDPITALKNIMDIMPRTYEKNDVESVVINDYRAFLYDLSVMMKNWQAVTVVIGESKPDEPYPYDVAYTMDGVLLLYNKEEENMRRKYLEVLKLRGTGHLTGKQFVDISKDGLVVQPGLR
ncbi:MAG: RAD55 family ATPase [Methanosarcinales archaeon]